MQMPNIGCKRLFQVAKVQNHAKLLLQLDTNFWDSYLKLNSIIRILYKDHKNRSIFDPYDRKNWIKELWSDQISSFITTSLRYFWDFRKQKGAYLK